MRRKTGIFLSFAFLGLLVSVLPGCGEPDNNSQSETVHTHNFVANYDDSYHWQECSECHEIKNKVAHSLELKNTVSATCKHGEVKSYCCDICGYKKEIDDYKKLAHKFSCIIEKEATCQEDGIYKYTCSDCNETYTVNYENSQNHNWDNGIKEGDLKIYSCLVPGCNNTYSVIDAKELTETTVSVTQLEDHGVELKEATIQLDQQTVSELDGDITLSADKVDNSALPETVGEETKQQIANAPVYDFSMSAGDEEVHEFAGRVKITIPYTLRENENPDNITIGYINGEGIEYISATYASGNVYFETTHFSLYAILSLSKEETCQLFGHNYANGKVIKESTCVEHGVFENICTRCGVSYTEELPLKDHSYSLFNSLESTETTHGYIEYKCESCGNIRHEELPLVLQGGGYYENLVNSLITGNLHIEYNVQSNGMHLSGLIYECVTNKDPLIYQEANTEYENSEKSSTVAVINKTGSYRFGNSNVSVDENNALEFAKSILEKLKTRPQTIQNLLNLVFGALENVLFTVEEGDVFNVIKVDFVKIQNFVEAIETLKITELFDYIFGENSFNNIYSIIQNFYTDTISETLQNLAEKNFDVKEILDFIDLISGDEDTYSKLFNEEALALTGEEFLIGMLPENLKMFATFEGIDEIVEQFKDMTVIEIIEGMTEQENISDMINGYVDEAIDFAKENVTCNITTTKSGNFISADVVTSNLAQLSFMPEEAGDASVCAHVDMDVDINKVSKDANEIISNVGKVDAHFNFTDSNELEKIVKDIYGVDINFEYYDVYHDMRNVYISEKTTALNSYLGLDRGRSVQLFYKPSEDYDGPNYYERVDDSHNFYGQNCDIYYFSNLSNNMRLFMFDEQNIDEPIYSGNVSNFYVGYDANNEQYLLLNDSGYISSETEHLYSHYETTTLKEYCKFNSYNYESAKKNEYYDSCSFYKCKCLICGQEKYSYVSTLDYRFNYNDINGLLMYPEMNKEAKQYSISIGTTTGYGFAGSGTRIYVSKKGSLGFEERICEMVSSGVTKTFSYGNVEITIKNSKDSTYDCCEHQEITISINDKVLHKFNNTLHNNMYSYDTVLVSKRETQCYTTTYEKRVCNHCGKTIGYNSYSEAHHDFETIATLFENDELLPTLTIEKCKNCNYFDWERNDKWHNIYHHNDSLYCEDCDNYVTPYNHLLFEEFTPNEYTKNTSNYEENFNSNYTYFLYDNYHTHFYYNGCQFSFGMCKLDDEGNVDIYNNQIISCNTSGLLNLVYTYRQEPQGSNGASIFDMNLVYSSFGFVGVDTNELNQLRESCLDSSYCLCIMVTPPESGNTYIYKI